MYLSSPVLSATKNKKRQFFFLDCGSLNNILTVAYKLAK